MRNWVSSEIESTIAILELLGSQSIQEVCGAITRQSRLVKKTLPEK